MTPSIPVSPPWELPEPDNPSERSVWLQYLFANSLSTTAFRFYSRNSFVSTSRAIPPWRHHGKQQVVSSFGWNKCLWRLQGWQQVEADQKRMVAGQRAEVQQMREMQAHQNRCFLWRLRFRTTKSSPLGDLNRQALELIDSSFQQYAGSTRQSSG